MDNNDQKLKILYLITKSNFGGAQRYVYDLATYANKKGHDVVVGFGGEGLLKEKLEVAGVRTTQIGTLKRDMSAGDDLRGFFRLVSLMWSEAPDVVHLNSSKIGGLGALAARLINVRTHVTNIVGEKRTPIRIIFTGHGWAFTEERPDWQRALIAGGHWLTIQLAHNTIAVSERTRDEVAQIPLTRHKLTVIHNGTDDIKTLARRTALTLMLGEAHLKSLPKGTIIIGTIGELHTNKGHNYALEALSLLKKQSKVPIRFIIIGDGEERERLVALRDALDLTEEGVFHQNANGREMLAGFDIFLFPSITEGFPYALLEAGNVGLPTIASAVGGIPEVIDDMQSGILIQSKNPGEIARSLAYLIDQPERRAEFGAALRERIKGRFSVETMADETFSLYNDRT